MKLFAVELSGLVPVMAASREEAVQKVRDHLLSSSSVPTLRGYGPIEKIDYLVEGFSPPARLEWTTTPLGADRTIRDILLPDNPRWTKGLSSFQRDDGMRVVPSSPRSIWAGKWEAVLQREGRACPMLLYNDGVFGLSTRILDEPGRVDWAFFESPLGLIQHLDEVHPDVSHVPRFEIRGAMSLFRVDPDGSEHEIPSRYC